MNLKTIAAYLQGCDDEGLFAEAEAVKRQVFGKDIYLRGIVEFSSFCCKRCRYCGLRAPNADAVRYRLPLERIMEAAALAPQLGLGTVVLQSGDDYHYSVDDICGLVSAIKQRQNTAVTLSLGDRPVEEFARFRESGADRYLLKLETTSPQLYSQVRPGEQLHHRLERLETLRSLGFEVGSGVIVGLPGSTLETLAADVRQLVDLDLDMIGVGPFAPHPCTPLAHEPCGDLQTTLRVTALLRILSPRTNIPATSALNSLAQHGDVTDGRAKGLHAGCNVIMPSLTPEEVRTAYEIYPGKNAFTQNAAESVLTAITMIKNEGFAPSPARGDRPRERTCNRRREAYALPSQ